MERQTPDHGTTRPVLVGLSQGAGVGINWPRRPDRGCAAGARPLRTDHGAGGRGRSRELVWCVAGEDLPDRRRAAGAILHHSVYPPCFRFWATVAAVSGASRLFLAPLVSL
ncbi:hypothetical protein NDU88_000102 [Pleurodeles waltl]|uniref:Uncharacterized protein n=1 Tax=Pleurodeles waltl TaxID=8319 RepID=A0AAV7UPK1_PLEWA|nr:hypothetical protein NDU88_000102 [Pleurodeles waltl]